MTGRRCGCTSTGAQVGSRAGRGAAADVDRGRCGLAATACGASSSQGRIDEVRLYNRALTATEIQADMNTPIGTTRRRRSRSQWAADGDAAGGHDTDDAEPHDERERHVSLRHRARRGLCALPNTFATTGGTTHSTLVHRAHERQQLHLLRALSGQRRRNAEPGRFLDCVLRGRSPRGHDAADGDDDGAGERADGVGQCDGERDGQRQRRRGGGAVPGRTAQPLGRGRHDGAVQRHLEFRRAWPTAARISCRRGRGMRRGIRPPSAAVSVTVEQHDAVGAGGGLQLQRGDGNDAHRSDGIGAHRDALRGRRGRRRGSLARALTFDGVNDWVTVKDAS